jgi:hypothetical protein
VTSHGLEDRGSNPNNGKIFPSPPRPYWLCNPIDCLSSRNFMARCLRLLYKNWCDYFMNQIPLAIQLLIIKISLQVSPIFNHSGCLLNVAE